MTTQTSTKIISIRSLFDFIMPADDPATQPNQFSASDLGYEISEDELADAMSSFIAGDLIQQPAPQVSPDEFEDIYTWFIS